MIKSRISVSGADGQRDSESVGLDNGYSEQAFHCTQGK